MAAQDAQLLTELKDIKETLKRAPAMNGGFDRLLVSVENIKERQENLSEKLERIYDPEDGTFARLASLENGLQKHATTMEAHAKESVEHAEKIESALDITSQHKLVIDRLQSVTGTHLDDLDAMIKFRKNFDKLYWLMAASIAGTVVKFIFDLLHK